MGRPKAALAHEGETFLGRIARLLAANELTPLLVVVGEHAEESRSAAPSELAIEFLVNTAPWRGQLSSLKLALARLANEIDPVDGVLVALVDHPAVHGETIHRLRSAAEDLVRRTARAHAILVPTHAGRRGHPVVFLRSVFEEIARTPDDLGARAVVRRDASRVLEIAVDDPGILRDIDTPADLDGS
jgi:molybdenum cofactor cytidylyltransferase